MGTQPLPKKEAEPPIFGPCLLWPNGWMDQDCTWHGSRPWSSPHYVRWRHSSPQKGQSPPIFVPSLLWPNGWMYPDATWYGDRPQPRRLCGEMGTQPLPQKGWSPTQFSAHVCCGQTAAWIKMPLVTELYLGLRDIVFDVDPATPRKRAQPPPPNFWPMSIVAKWLDG